MASFCDASGSRCGKGNSSQRHDGGPSEPCGQCGPAFDLADEPDRTRHLREKTTMWRSRVGFHASHSRGDLLCSVWFSVFSLSDEIDRTRRSRAGWSRSGSRVSRTRESGASRIHPYLLQRGSRAKGRLPSPTVLGRSTAQIPTNASESGLTGALEVFHEYPLEFEGCLLSCAQMPGAKKSDPD
jgi:hypothetical protein